MAKIGFFLTFVFVVLTVASTIVSYKESMQLHAICRCEDCDMTKYKCCQYNCIDFDLTKDFISQNWRLKMDNG